MAAAYENCTSVSLSCPVTETIYGYPPSLGFNAFFLSYFLLASILQSILVFRYKNWFFGFLVVTGCMGEVVGYIGRMILHGNAWSDIGFEIQISCLIFSPSWIVAGVYLTLRRIVKTFGAEKSRIPAKLYTWVFLSFDTFCLLLQAIGGGIAASSGTDIKSRDLGTNLMIAGIILQVVVLVFFGGLVIDYTIRTRRSWEQVPANAKRLAATKPFKLFCIGATVAFCTIFARCIYRIAEMIKGWANPIMRDEAGFIGMEGFMIVIAVFCLTVFHPGYCFPERFTNGKSKTPADGSAEVLEKERSDRSVAVNTESV